MIKLDRRRIAKRSGIVNRILIIGTTVLRTMRIRRRDDGQIIGGRQFHESRIRRDLRNRIPIECPRIHIDNHIGLFQRLDCPRQIRCHIKIRQDLKKPDIERMAEHILQTGCCQLLDFLRIPLIDVPEGMAVPFSLDLS